MSGELPKNWTEASLGQLATYINGKGFKKSEWREDGLPIIRIQNLNNPLATFNYTNERHEERYKVLKGDLLVAWSASLGAYLWEGEEAWLNQHIFKVQPDLRLVSKSFLYYAVKNSIDELYKVTHGMGMVHVTKGKFEGHGIWLPPLNEQIRIANKLDSLLAKVDAAQARLEKIPGLVKRFRQSVLAAATSGDLTKGWALENKEYYENIAQEIEASKKLSKLSVLSSDEIIDARNSFNNPDWGRWKLFALEQLVSPARGIPYGIVQTGEAQEIGIPTVRCGDVRPLSIRIETLKKVSSEIERKYVRTRLKGGEVLLAIRGTVGNASIVTEQLASLNANISREVAMIPVRDNVSSQYIALLLQSPGGFKCLAEKVRGVAQKGINLADVKRFVTPLPSLEEQKEIVRRVESLFALAEVVEKQYTEAKKRIDRLVQSLLAKAFRGELVPQDPSDEPAVELLNRIQAEHELQPENKPKRQTGRRKSGNKNNDFRSKKSAYMNLNAAPDNYLLDLLSQLGGEAHPKVLWSKTELTIDDFYAQLKEEMQSGSIIDDNASSDPTLRKLKLAKPAN